MRQYAKVINCFDAILLTVVVVVAATNALTACGKKEKTAAVGPPEVLVVEAPTRDVPVYREWLGTFDKKPSCSKA